MPKNPTRTSPKPVTSTLDTALRFEDALTELEQIIRNMEGDQGNALDLENALTAYQRGMALLQHCQGQLAEAEERIRVLTPSSPANLPT